MSMTISRSARLALTLLLAASWGCGGDKIQGEVPADPARDYAQGLRMQVTEFVANSRANMREAGENASVLLEELGDHESRELGEYQQTVAQLHEKVKQIADGAASDVAGTLTEIESLAGNLPSPAAPADGE